MSKLDRPPQPRMARRIGIAFLLITSYGALEYFLPFSTFLKVSYLTSAEETILYRLVSGILVLAFALMFNPSWRRYLRLPRGRNRWLASAALISFYLFVHLQDMKESKFSLPHILLGIIFVFTIGFSEEITSRFFIFGLLNRYLGVWGALALSAINFGMMHIGNAFGGDQGYQETAIQALSAASAGFMFASLLLFTRSLWIPIIVHATVDLSLGLGTSPAHATRNSGGVHGHGLGWADWGLMLIDILINVGLGLVFLYSARLFRPGREAEGVKMFFGLIESDKPSIRLSL